MVLEPLKPKVMGKAWPAWLRSVWGGTCSRATAQDCCGRSAGTSAGI